MKKYSAILLFCCFALLAAAEYTVTPADSLQKAVNKLQPGDILTLKEGVYRQGTVTITARGTAEKPIIIRGADRGRTLVTAWRSLDDARWEAVPNQRFVYRTRLKEEVFNITDLNTEQQLLTAPAVHDMDLFRGTFRREKGYLYLHSCDGKRPGRGLRATVHSGYLFLLQNAAHIKIEELTFCGSAYKDPRYSSWAIAIRCIATSDIAVERCSFLYNSGGAAFTSKSLNSSARNCFFHRNDAPGYAEAAQLFFGGASKNNLAENNLVINTGVHGIRFYSGAIDNVARQNVIVNSRIGLYYKATAGKRLAERNVVVDSTSFNYSDLQGGRPIRDIGNTFALPSDVYDPNPTNLLFRAKDDPKFCAPEYYDYRLQKNSPFLGKGAFPKAAKVFYLSPAGSDANDGGSAAKPFRSFGRAMKAASGATLYLLPGNYPELKGKVTSAQLRGLGKVSVKELDLTGSEKFSVEGLNVSRVILKNTKAGVLRNCTVGNVVSGEDTRIYNCNLEKVSGKARIYDSLQAGKAAGSFPESPVLPGVRVKTPPSAGTPEKPVFTFYGDKVTVIWGTPGVSADHYRVKNSWWSPRPSTSYLEYGTTPAMGKKAFSSGNIFHRVILSGVVPGQKYYCRVVIPAHPFARKNNDKWRKADFTGVQKSGSADVRGAAVSFTVPAPRERKAAEYFVSPAGKDSNNGISAQTPFRSIARAAAKALPGDTVTLLPGTYYDAIVPLHSGLPGKFITFRAAKGGDVILDGANFMRPGGIVCKELEYIRFQGFIFRNYANKLYANRGGANFGMAQLYHSRNIEITDCVFSAFGTYQHPVILVGNDKVKLKNCVFARGVSVIDGTDNGSIEIRNCTFYVSEIHHFTLTRQLPGSTVTVRNNLFVGLTGVKALNRVDRVGINGKEFKVDFDNNCWYFSPKDKYRYCGGEGGKIKLDSAAGVKRLFAKTGWGKNDIEITSIKFKGHTFYDPFDPRFGKVIGKNFVSGKIVPNLRFFEAEQSDKYGVKNTR